MADEVQTRAHFETLLAREKALKARTRVHFASTLNKRWEPTIRESVEEALLRLGWNWDAPRRPASEEVLELRRFIERAARACGFEYRALRQAPREAFAAQDAARWAAIVASKDLSVDDVNAVLDARRLGDFFFTERHWIALGGALERYPLHDFVQDDYAMHCAACHALNAVWCATCEACSACAQRQDWGHLCDLQPDRTDPCTNDKDTESDK
ncbi:Hypothetical Protein FCC1311_080842 [Hondaea fermentalgiana]|uniref:Uncharacterized protein n=1 Tax=Hondaea fermentalgiana TaxID=2315210 RepID=A0A2R5GNI2_9STRA|nr:Hypothetical Protein FCC1311_080842 [Hondaea fermentalgiana]|eukprot:GBG31859.1 Hypothetical Protein FCC1311_080842 [Hondaea fermentalgiana]